MFGGGFPLFLFLDLSFRWWWFFNAAGGGVGVIWFMRCVLFSSVFCLLRSGSGFVPFSATDRVLLLVQASWW
jgi:hypothetical protein